VILGRAPLLMLLAVGAASIGLISIVDDTAFSASSPAWPTLALLARIRVPSLVVCATLYALVARWGAAWTPSVERWRAILWTSLAWLLPTAFFVLVVRVWVPPLRGPVDVVAFLCTGLLAEELLFRGAIFRLADLSWQGAQGRAVVVSALLFGASHVQYHGFQVTRPALIQVAYTTALGLFLGRLRGLSNSLWPPAALHVANNLLTLLR
jgi:membrane protease YdiL (CAAX protease family)